MLTELLMSMEYFKDRSENGNIYDLINVMSLVQEDRTVLESSVRVVDGEVNMSNVELLI